MIVTFELVNPGQNYEPLIKKIMEYGDAIRLSSTSYLLGSDRTAVEVRDNLVSEMAFGDKLYIGAVAMSAAWYGLGAGTSDSIRAIFDRFYVTPAPDPSPAASPRVVT